MPELLHQKGVERLIPARERATLMSYAEQLIQELPEPCVNCPAAYVCALALSEDSGYGFPRTPLDVSRMHVSQGEFGYSLFSGQAQFALKGIVSDANERGTGPTEDGSKCCLDPSAPININVPINY